MIPCTSLESIKRLTVVVTVVTVTENVKHIGRLNGIVVENWIK